MTIRLSEAWKNRTCEPIENFRYPGRILSQAGPRLGSSATVSTALKFAQIRLRLSESEPLERIIPDLFDVASRLGRKLETPHEARGALFRLSLRKASKSNGSGAPLLSPSISAA
jgi:hypothetical protein